MQRKTEKGDLVRVLSCMRMALYNESIADMATKLGISPTYLNSIECEIRPCTFKILENIYEHLNSTNLYSKYKRQFKKYFIETCCCV